MRYRRYRVFLVLTAVALFLLYRLSHTSTQWTPHSVQDPIIPKHFADEKNHYSNTGRPETVPNPLALKDKPYIPDPPELPAETKNKINPPARPPVQKPVQRPPPKAVNRPNVAPGVKDGSELILAEGGEARQTLDTLPTPIPIPIQRWSPRPDHFPVPTASIIPLPTGVGKPLPKIQATFSKESKDEKESRLQKLSMVKEAFLHAWNGYKTRAWGKDELSPVSGRNRNTFNGWSATLVDSMDTMWIMGLKEEFEEAVGFVKTIDFHTSQRKDIPLFETTIRYLGGLLGAYDVSEGKYPVLLEKAVMLGDMLMGAFDTPNRMPMTYFTWMSAYTSQPHRAPSRVVLAEIASLQMEFTRLAQLTGNSTYYDAVTRIIDLLAVWQDNTAIPGLWPADMDTSGCNTSASTYSAPNRMEETNFLHSLGDEFLNPVDTLPPIALNTYRENEGKQVPEMVPIKKPDPLVLTVKDKEEPKALGKRQVGHIENPVPPNSIPEQIFTDHRADYREQFQVEPEAVTKLPECVPKGLDFTDGGWGKYTLGSTADSAYEYFPKMYILLNGQVDRYRTMYEKAADAATDNLIYRIMINDTKRELYGSGERRMTIKDREGPLTAESTHLTCFVGGMYGLGSKLFDRPKDLEIAKKLTDGCVWAYESTATGIMPETMYLSACKDMVDCPFNATLWYSQVDPYFKMRQSVYEQRLEVYEGQLKMLKEAAKERAADTATATGTATGARAIVTQAQEGSRAPPKGFDPHAHADQPKKAIHKDVKRPEDIKAPEPMKKRAPPPPSPHYQPPTPTQEDDFENTEPTSAEEVASALYSPEAPLSNEEFARQKIEEDKLVPGIKSINDPRYLLR